MSSGYDFFCKIILRVSPLPVNFDAAEPLNSALAGEILLCEHQEKVFCPVRHDGGIRSVIDRTSRAVLFESH